MRYRSPAWWSWVVVVGCLATYLSVGWRTPLLVAIAISTAQALYLGRQQRWLAVQVRLLFSTVALAALWPPLAWMHWLQVAGLGALVGFDYCLASRMLQLLPWNRRSPLTLELVRRTVFSMPRRTAGLTRVLGDELVAVE